MPPESDPTLRQRSEGGLCHKYDVRKAGTGAAVEDCFVLRPDRDPAARIAVLAYAYATGDADLSSDLHRWMQAIYDAEPDRVEAVRLQIVESMVADAARRQESARRALDEADFSLGYARESLERIATSGQKRERDA